MLYFPKGDTAMSMQDEQQIERYIELNPHKPWLAEAWLKDYGIAVWALVGHLGAVDGDVDRVAADYEVPRAVVEAALAYYRRHKSLIDARIAANSTDEVPITGTLASTM